LDEERDKQWKCPRKDVEGKLEKWRGMFAEEKNCTSSLKRNGLKDTKSFTKASIRH
jgi:hypothetical protein